ATWPGQSTSSGDVYVVHDSLSATLKHVYVEVNANAQNQNMNGTWQITMLADHLGSDSGEVDMWRYLVAPSLTASFVSGNLPTQELISEPGNATNIITRSEEHTSELQSP